MCIIIFILQLRCPVPVPGSGAFPNPSHHLETTATASTKFNPKISTPKFNPKISTPKFQSPTKISSSDSLNLSTNPKQKSSTLSIPRPYPLKQRLMKKHPGERKRPETA
ncbi:unnamed protein product [Rotaria magnacalcarata]|uniref:Uncharacterized protein n=1 Tax=Rotaria magnacalcarata TaxID=392030 RepID=A0A819T4Z1_9BILA|nr:unnamed protein product [Rotaria magnacalcarata]